MKRTALFLLLAQSLVAQKPDPREAHWTRLTTSDFDLYTCAPEKEGRELLRSFEQIRGFFQKASPVPLLEDFPVRVVAFESKDQFSFYSPGGKVVAYYVPGTRTDYIVMQDPSRESYPFGIHEYVHLLVKHSGIRLPVWLNEGWADVYSTLRPVRDGVAVGDLIPARVKTLETSAWLSLDALASVTSESVLISENTRIGIFYAESWALTHMLFLSPEYANNFPKFLSAVNRGRSMEDSFQAAWGRTTAQVFADLQTYMKRSRMTGRVFEAPLGKSESAVEAKKVDAFDARLMLADLSVALNRRTEAKAEFEALALLRPDNAQVSEALGFAALSIKEYDKARTEFEKVYAAGGNDPRMCLELALLEARARQGRDKVLPPLKRALEAKPDYIEAQIELGLYHVALREYNDAIGALTSIKKITPDRALPVFGSLAYAYFETGDLEKARADALYAKQFAREPHQVAGQDQLIAMIDARAKSAYPPKPGEPIARVDGILKAIDCGTGSPRLEIAAGDRTVVLDLPDMKAVELSRVGQEKDLTLSCGPQRAVRLAIDYAPASVVKEGSSGVVRRIEY
jgi:tetratricopeptide (TPR) repeat protein